MHLASISETDPAAFLAWDEALLDAVEEGEFEAMLWFWESAIPLVAIGYGQKIEREVDLPACASRNIPVLRRCSGGGAVVLGPGCLSYGLALRMDAHQDLATIPGANAWIMNRLRKAIINAVGPGSDTENVRVRGYTDLAWGERKFSGNAQRRRRVALLFHGTFLLNFDLPLIGAVLRSPSAQPDYRSDRSHEEFVMNLTMPRATVERAICEEWSARPIKTDNLPRQRMQTLLQERYSRSEFHTSR